MKWKTANWDMKRSLHIVIIIIIVIVMCILFHFFCWMTTQPSLFRAVSEPQNQSVFGNKWGFVCELDISD